jgi:hypothetical protein
MQGYWIKFTDGSAGYCEGQNAFDAVGIAEKLTGKTAIVGENKYQPKLDTLPYPATPIIWQFDHPTHGKCPAFCYSPEQCNGRTSCPKDHACDD